MIDWEGTRIAFNLNNGTHYRTDYEFLESLYKKYKSTPKMGEIIYVSHSAIYHKMIDLGIELLPKGFRFPSEKQKILLSLNTEKMTRKEIQDKIGASKHYTLFMLRKFEKKWIKLKN